jgi:hypothetical protein
VPASFRRCLSSTSTEAYRTARATPFTLRCVSPEYLAASPLNTFSNVSVPLRRDFDGISLSILREYKLPTVWYNGETKKTIVDPSSVRLAYDLPSLVNRVMKDAPTMPGSSVPLGDPVQTSDVVKVTLPYLMTIRHKKMKRHKLRKLRKRMRFVMRKRRAFKQRRKEQAIQEVERKFAKEAADYDPEKYIEEQMSVARKSGWGIDVVAEFVRNRKSAVRESADRR